MRLRLGLDEDTVMVAWVGRLSFYEKAFPQPMMRAVAEAKAKSGAPLMFVMAGWFPDGDQDRKLYEEAVRAYAPNLDVVFIDGNDSAAVSDLWASADIFLSLVDNIQETFGITPIEAMAAALPVVVSDWDGYRANVQHGVHGFLVPTLGGAPGEVGEKIAASHMLQAQSYQVYVGQIAQHTAVNMDAAAEAIATLALSPDLRRRMGAAGQAHVRETFDWPVIVSAYKALFDDLATRRPSESISPALRLNPIHGDPFRDFAGFATQVLHPDLKLVLRDRDWRAALARSKTVTLDGAFAGRRLDGDAVADLVQRLDDAGGAASVRVLLDHLPPSHRSAGEATLVWLTKLGVLDWALAT